MSNQRKGRKLGHGALVNTWSSTVQTTSFGMVEDAVYGTLNLKAGLRIYEAMEGVNNMCSGMKGLWEPISELKDKYSENLLLTAPDLVDLDCNPIGVSPGYWQDGPFTPGGNEEGVWIAAGYDMCNDMFVNKVCNPTHFIIMEGPDI